MRIKDLVPWAHKSGEATAGEDAAHPVASLQREMNRIFDDFWGRFDRPFGVFTSGPNGAGAASDVVETDNAIEVSVELPGMEEKDIDVSLSDDTLTIKGEKQVERKEEKKGYYVSERTYGSVYRSIPLPVGVNTDEAEAKFKNGVLTVTLPKSDEAQERVRKIAVKSE